VTPAARRAVAVRAARDVVQTAVVRPQCAGVVDLVGVAGEGVDRGDDRRGCARPAEGQPAAGVLERITVVDRDAGRRVGDRGDVGDRAAPTGGCGLRLPGRVVAIRAAAAAVAPGRLG